MIKIIRFTKPKRKVSKVFIHCSASDVKAHDNIATITKWHTDPKPPKGVRKTAGYGNGWKWVGYHFFIRKDGTIEEGRTLEEQPSAQGLYKGSYYNAGSIAICLSGKHPDFFTQEQFDSLKYFCQKINDIYDNKITFHGHCEVSDKECPVFDYKTILNLDDEGYIKFSLLFTNSKPKKKMIFPLAISLVKLFAPSIINRFKRAGKNLAEDTAKKLIQKAEKKLGFKITDVKSAEKAKDQLDSKDLLELEKVALKTEAKMFSDELKYGEDLSKSWKDEFVTVLTFTFFGVIVLMGYCDSKPNEGAVEMVKVIKALLSTPFGALFLFVGVSAIGGKHIMTKIADKFIK